MNYFEITRKYCDEYVCVCVLEDICGTTRTTFTEFFVHIAYGCGSVLQRRCNILLLQSTCFSIMGRTVV